MRTPDESIKSMLEVSSGEVLGQSPRSCRSHCIMDSLSNFSCYAIFQVEAMLEGMGEMTFQHAHKPVDMHMGFEERGQPGNHYQRRNVEGDMESTCACSFA